MLIISLFIYVSYNTIYKPKQLLVIPEKAKSEIKSAPEAIALAIKATENFPYLWVDLALSILNVGIPKYKLLKMNKFILEIN